MIKSVYCISCKVIVILVRFQWKLNVCDRVYKNSQISNFKEIRQVGAELFHAEGRTDGHYKSNDRYW